MILGTAVVAGSQAGRLRRIALTWLSSLNQACGGGDVCVVGLGQCTRIGWGLGWRPLPTVQKNLVGILGKSANILVRQFLGCHVRVGRRAILEPNL